MRAYHLIDADCHTLEPPHLWSTWLPEAFRDRAPQLVKDEDGGDAWSFGEGKPLMYIGLVATPGMRYEDMKWRGYGYDDIRRGCFDGKARLEDMDQDGVDAEFLFPSQRTMYHFMGNEDRDFHHAGVQAYNDWLGSEFCAADPTRLFGLAQMPNLGVDEAIAEMKRCKEKGFRGVIIAAWPNGGDTLGPEDDRFFAAAQEMGMPISIHIRIIRPGRKSTGALEGPAAIANMALSGMSLFPEVMCEIIMSGVHDRVGNDVGVANMAWSTGLPAPRQRLALFAQDRRRDARRGAGARTLRHRRGKHGAHLRVAAVPRGARMSARGAHRSTRRPGGARTS